MLYILLGEDDFSLNESLEEIKRSAGEATMLAANTTTLEGQQVTLEQLQAVCSTAPFLAERRLVIIKGLLERFDSKGKTPQPKRAARTASRQDEHKSMAAYMREAPDSTVLALVDGKIRGNNPLLKELTDRAEVRSFPLLREAKLRQWIEKRAARAGGSISPQAVRLLSRLVGSNLWILSSEIEKLALFASGRRIEEEDVRAMVSYAQETTVFEMVDAILESRGGAAERALQMLLQRGAAPAYLLAMLSRQAQMIVRMKEMDKRGRPKAEIQGRLGLADFAWQKTAEQASRFSLKRLSEVYHKLLEADLAIKTGKYEGELALNILIAELCQERSGAQA